MQFSVERQLPLIGPKPVEPCIYTNLLAIPTYVAAGSLLYVTFKVFHRRGRVFDVPAARSYVDFHGSRTIFTCMALRVVCSLVLIGLSPAKSPLQICEMGVLLYSSVLALFALFSISNSSRTATRQYNLVLLACFGVYFYRDVFPLMTYTKQPQDAELGSVVLWIKVALLSFLGVALPLGIPRPYIPIDPKNPTPEVNAEQTASLFSLMMHYYLDPVVFRAYALPHLPFSELPPLADYDMAEGLKKRAFPELDAFSGARKRHLFFGLLTVFKWDFTVMLLSLVVHVIATFLSPIGLNRLLAYLESDGEDVIIRPWVWIGGLFLGPLVAAVAVQWYIYLATRLLTVASAIITQLTFEHALRIRMKASTSASPGRPVSIPSTTDGSVDSNDDTINDSASIRSDDTAKPMSSEISPTQSDTSNLIGKINNLVTTDLENVVEARDFLFIVVYVPLQIALSIGFLYVVLGWSAFVGLAFILLMMFVPIIVAKFTQAIQQNRLQKTDARVQLVTETLSVLRMIKLFGWEKKMDGKIAEKRQEELVWIRKRQMLDLVNGTLNFIIPLATMIITYGFQYTIVMKGTLSASIVFSSMSIFDMLREQLHLIFGTVTEVIAGKVSLDRMNAFLHDTELLDSFSVTEEEVGVTLSFNQAPEGQIGFNNASFVWSNNVDGSLTPSKRNFTLVLQDEVVFERGGINLVVGPTGSGKTSLLMALLGEMHFVPRSVDAWFNLPREKGVAYAAQESWVQNETIRDNILFGSPYDQVRYEKVIYQCGLQRDLTLFEAGDQTEVGEKGLTLSGGQKARVTLARAIYSPAEIILLDDVLAALDVHTSKWIVDRCFSGDLVKGRTIILVTHNITLVQPITSYVISIRDGHVVAQGSPIDVLAVSPDIKEELQQEKEIMEKADQEVDIDADEPSHDNPKNAANTHVPTTGQLIMAEEIEEGHLSWPALKLYFHALGGGRVWLFFLAFIGGLTLTQVFNILQTWWLGHWASKYDDNVKVPVFFYIGIYSLMAIGGVLFFSVAFMIYIFGSIRASRTIHQRLVTTVLGTTLRWLDTTPTSRIITRCTQDIRSVDGPLAMWFLYLVEVTVMLIVKFLAIVVVTPVFMIPAIVVFAAGSVMGQIYIKAQMSVKREMSNAKAPVLSHFGAAIGGLTSIRAYSAQTRFIDESLKRIDRFSRTSRTFFNLNRWICIRVDALGGLFASALATYLVYFVHGTEGMGASTTGFELNMAIGFSGLILWWIRNVNEFEIQGNSLERIQNYLKIEQEPASTARGEPPAYWPASGKLVVENLSAKYSSDGPKVLHDVSFELKSGERVGVVGRTGSGKSSLTLSLLRCIFTEGKVWYDGIDTSTINLDALRRSVTIIPQMPELLSGTLRQNLDPFSQYDDATLNDALRASGLFALQDGDDDDSESSDEGKITLDTPISSGGNNLSVGQRQILALARAIVRGSKLLILDEATSAIDYKTDTIIQSSLRSDAALRDVTVITVAHRLQTIMDADKIMVLDGGKVVEFGTPRELVGVEGGTLRGLVEESRDKDVLIKMALGKGQEGSR